MKKLFLILIALVSSFSFGQKAKNGWQTAKLKCKVKAAGQTEYVFNQKGERIQQGQNFSAKFNKKGNITEMKMKHGDETTQLVMEFATDGFPIKTTAYNEKGEITFHSEQQNDKKGNILLEKGFTDGDFEAFKNIFSYDKKGYLIEKKMYQLGNYAMKSIYINDKKGNPIEEKNYDANDQLKHRIVSKYDKKGNRTEAIAYDASGTVFEHYTYKYDKQNNLIEEKSYTPSGSLSYHKTFVYQYDKRKNWTQKTEYTDGKMTMVAEQFIEYF